MAHSYGWILSKFLYYAHPQQLRISFPSVQVILHTKDEANDLPDQFDAFSLWLSPLFSLGGTIGDDAPLYLCHTIIRSHPSSRMLVLSADRSLLLAALVLCMSCLTAY